MDYNEQKVKKLENGDFQLTIPKELGEEILLEDGSCILWSLYKEPSTTLLLDHVGVLDDRSISYNIFDNRNMIHVLNKAIYEISSRLPYMDIYRKFNDERSIEEKYPPYQPLRDLLKNMLDVEEKLAHCCNISSYKENMGSHQKKVLEELDLLDE